MERKCRCDQLRSVNLKVTCSTCEPVRLTNIEASAITKGIKHDKEKPDMSLLSAIATIKVAEVMTFGKNKYSAHNWRGGFLYSRLLAATLRHVFAYLGGESLDPESGLSHLAHACCCLNMLLEFETTRPDLDDRYKPEVK